MIKLSAGLILLVIGALVVASVKFGEDLQKNLFGGLLFA